MRILCFLRKWRCCASVGGEVWRVLLLLLHALNITVIYTHTARESNKETIVNSLCIHLEYSRFNTSPFYACLKGVRNIYILLMLRLFLSFEIIEGTNTEFYLVNNAKQDERIMRRAKIKLI